MALSNLQLIEETWVETPVDPNFRILVRYASKARLEEIRKNSYVQKLARNAMAQPETVLDESKFLHAFVTECVKDWEGLTYDILSQLIPIEVPEGQGQEEIEFTSEDAIWLIENQGVMLDEWLFEAIRSVQNFTKSK